MSSDLLTFYQMLQRLSERQLVALEEEELETFWQLTEERDSVFANLEALEPQARGLKAEQRREIAGLIPAILTNDERIGVHMDRLSATVRRELVALQTGMTALQSYNQEQSSESVFIDLPR